MEKTPRKYNLLRKIFYFFPIQLLLIHLRSNFFIMSFWAFLLLLITGNLGKNLGIQFLFLEPEYLEKVNLTSFFIVGIMLGVFISAFNVSSYILNSKKFPFLATVNRPFIKYCLNNSIIPIIFGAVYFYELTDFYSKNIPYQVYQIFYAFGAIAAGVAVYLFFMLSYFFAFAKDVKRLFGANVYEDANRTRRHRIYTKIEATKFSALDKNQVKPLNKLTRDIWPVETYLSHPFKIRLARPGEHYDETIIARVYDQNHFYALIFVIINISLILLLGWFRETPALILPAGASIFLLTSIFMMGFGALHYLFGKWTVVVTVAGLLIYNALSTHSLLSTRSFAPGLDYEGEYNVYNPDSIAIHYANADLIQKDKEHHLGILEKWRRKASKGSKTKPKMIFINCSGGGVKSAMWTFYSLQSADKLLEGRLLRQTHLITGSSGGMLGAAFLRELYLRKQNGIYDDFYNDSLCYKLGSDILNAVASYIVLNDMFIRTKYIDYEGFKYPKDRGYAFEQRFNKLTEGYLDKKVVQYAQAELNSEIPLMIFSPTIINDGRRMLISPQPCSFLCNKQSEIHQEFLPKAEDIEFMQFFKNKKSESLSFLSALRMNATFPFVMPPVSLPTIPAIEVMDAGIRDNYGFRTSIKYLYNFREWVEKNTSGVIFIEISDGHRVDKESLKQKKKLRSTLQNLLMPLGGVLGNVTLSQVYNNEQDLQYMSGWFNGKIDIIKFDLTDLKSEEISMSLHLTQKEKFMIRNSVNLPSNQISFLKLKELLN
jgi:ABC-type multidrug transport system fused ATPase/permease subunit